VNYIISFEVDFFRFDDYINDGKLAADF